MQGLGGLPVTLFDIAAGVIVLLSALVALGRGMVREVLGIVCWVGAAVVAWYAYDAVLPLAKQAIGHELLAQVATGAGVFLIPLIVLKIIAGMLAGGVDGGRLGVLDRVGGLLFGIVRGAVLVCLAWLTLGMLVKPEQQPTWVREAYLRRPVELGADWLRSLLPPELAEKGETAAARAGEGARKLEAVREVMGSSRQPADAGYSDTQRDAMDKLVGQGQ
ncbi:MAG: CvpA family protein [Geminicoccaceae bacterium]